MRHLCVPGTQTQRRGGGIPRLSARLQAGGGNGRSLVSTRVAENVEKKKGSAGLTILKEYVLPGPQQYVE